MTISSHQDHPSTTLRDHISLNWPPVWTKATRNDGADPSRGEIGVLRYVHFSNSTHHKCYLVIEHEGEHFVGTLLFHDPALHDQIANLLRKHIGSSIREIGNLEIAQPASGD
jgi:hypothetical protein